MLMPQVAMHCPLARGNVPLGQGAPLVSTHKCNWHRPQHRRVGGGMVQLDHRINRPVGDTYMQCSASSQPAAGQQQPELKRHLLFPRHDKKSEATSSEDALEALRAENAELREAVAGMLDSLSEMERESFLQKHAMLREEATGVGEVLPQISGQGVASESAPEAPPAEAANDTQGAVEATLNGAPGEAAVMEAATGADEELPAASAMESNGWRLSPDGDAAILDGEDEVTFSFGGMVDQIKRSLGVSSVRRRGGSKGLQTQGPAASRLPRGSLPPSSGPKASSSSHRLQAVNGDRAESESSRSAAGTVVAEPPKQQGDQGVDEETLVASELGGGQDADPLKPSHSVEGLKAAAAAGRHRAEESSAAADVGSRQGGGGMAAAREAADAAVAGHSATEVVRGKEHWLYFTHPERPVAGAQVAIYFNNNVSDILREKPRRQIHLKYNNWELEGEAGAWLDLEHTNAPHERGADWWRVVVRVPEDAFEMNYVFTDGEGASDNNQGKNYLTPVESTMTPEQWAELAIDRQIAAEKARKAEEAAQREAAERERREAEEAQDRTAARARAVELRESVAYHRQGAVGRLERPGGQLAWCTEPEVLQAGQRGRLLYNCVAGPLSFMAPLPSPPTLILGHNGWLDTQELIMERAEAPAGQEGGDWWAAEVDVLQDAAVVNFVLQYYEHFDNNEGQDFRAVVEQAGGGSLEEFEERKLEEIYANLRKQRADLEQQWARKERLRAETRAKAKAKAKAVLRRQMRHVLFTEPADIQAGGQATIYYNPADTLLSGTQQVFLTGGWNRWTHPKRFGPLEMMPPENEGAHFRATVDVPRNAHSLEFVFANVAEGEGIHDNRGGLDYSLPVEGSQLTPPGLHVVHVAVEMAPICKVGGLGDVVTALGRAVQEHGHMVEVILPRYDFFLASPLLGATRLEAEFDWGGTHIWVSTCVVQGLRCFFIEPANGFFAVGSVYGRNDDAKRFEFFNKAALEFLLVTGRQPDILHCHDWSTAGVAQAYWDQWHHYGLWKPKVVFTIHNAEFGLDRIGMAAYYSQRFTTVSPTYAYEIGGNPAIASHAGKFMGIRNGIDSDIWDPENDDLLPRPYNADTVVEGKAAARESLRYWMGLTGWGDKPLVGVVTRLTAQKGLHLIKHAAWRTLERGGQFVLLGSAPDPKIQAGFNALAATLSGENAHFAFSYDESLSHLIYAGCDIILVPSIFEPCGLTQLIAMRYGSVPVVRSTGGLRDTVFDVELDKARAAWELEGSSDWERDGLDVTNGFAFEGTDEGALDYGLNRALDAYYNDRAWFNSLAARIMRQDWSWNRPAIDYISLYWQAKK